MKAKFSKGQIIWRQSGDVKIGVKVLRVWRDTYLLRHIYNPVWATNKFEERIEKVDSEWTLRE